MTCTWENCENKRWARGYCSKHYYSAQRHGLLPRPKCKIDACEQPSFRNGMCNTHNLRAERHGDPLLRKKRANGEAKNTACEIEGCSRPQSAQGLCSVHYGRKRRHGDPLAAPKRLANGMSTPERRKEVARRAFLTYQKTPHGKMRGRFNNAKARVLNGATSRHVPKEEFLKLWNGNHCGICSGLMFDEQKSIDHIIPISKGGSNEIRNLQMAHLLCNQRKSDRSPVCEATP